MKNLLVMERYVLEALESGPKNFAQMYQATEVDYGLLNNILSELMIKNMVRYDRGRYCLNLEEKSNWLSQVNSKECLSTEVKELFGTFVTHHFDGEELNKDKDKNKELKVQKLYMTSEEEKIFQTYLINMEKFIKDVQREQKARGRQGQVKEKKIVVWGKANYESVVRSSLKAI